MAAKIEFNAEPQFSHDGHYLICAANWPLPAPTRHHHHFCVLKSYVDIGRQTVSPCLKFLVHLILCPDVPACWRLAIFNVHEGQIVKCYYLHPIREHNPLSRVSQISDTDHSKDYWGSSVRSTIKT